MPNWITSSITGNWIIICDTSSICTLIIVSQLEEKKNRAEVTGNNSQEVGKGKKL